MNKLKLSIIVALLMPAVALADSHQGYLPPFTTLTPNVTPTTVAPGGTITVEFEYTVTIIGSNFNGTYPNTCSQWEIRLDANYQRTIPSLVMGQPNWLTGGPVDPSINVTETFYVNVDVTIPEDTDDGPHFIYLYSCPWSYMSAWHGAWYLIPITVENPVVEVDIDIKPGSFPNPINQGSNGLIPVAIFTTDDFDAADVDPGTVTLAGADVAVRGKSEKLMAHLEDVDGDGDIDLLLQVDTQSEDALWEEGEVFLEGLTYNGMPILGSDYVIIVPPE